MVFRQPVEPSQDSSKSLYAGEEVCSFACSKPSYRFARNHFVTRLTQALAIVRRVLAVGRRRDHRNPPALLYVLADLVRIAGRVRENQVAVRMPSGVSKALLLSCSFLGTRRMDEAWPTQFTATESFVLLSPLVFPSL